MRIEAIQAPTFGTAWFKLLNRILGMGKRVSPRGQETRELLGVQLHVEDLTQNILHSSIRDLNYRFLVAEWLWILRGRQDLASLARYNKQYAAYSDDGIYLAGAYGPRLAGQWRWLEEQFATDPTTRQAVATIWTPTPQKSKDIPCTISAQFIARDGRLHGIWTMRSSDIWWGLPYDFFTFAQLTNVLAGRIGARPGSLTMQLGSSHLYQPFYGKAEDVVDAGMGAVMTVRSPELRFGYDLCTVDRVFNRPEEPVVPQGGFAWPVYVEILQSKNKEEALRLLMKLEEDVYAPAQG